MDAKTGNVVWSNATASPRLVTTGLIASTRVLVEHFGESVRDQFARAYSITIIGAVLFDLMLKTQGEHFTPDELVQHVETVVVEDLKIAEESPRFFHLPPYPQILATLYDHVFLRQVWPQLIDQPNSGFNLRANPDNFP